MKCHGMFCISLACETKKCHSNAKFHCIAFDSSRCGWMATSTPAYVRMFLPSQIICDDMTYIFDCDNDFRMSAHLIKRQQNPLFDIVVVLYLISYWRIGSMRWHSLVCYALGLALAAIRFEILSGRDDSLIHSMWNAFPWNCTMASEHTSSIDASKYQKKKNRRCDNSLLPFVKWHEMCSWKHSSTTIL